MAICEALRPAVTFLFSEHRRYWLLPISIALCLQCFDAVGWVAGRASGL